MKKAFAMLAVLLAVFMMPSCGRKEKPEEKLFDADPIEFGLPPEHGFDPKVTERIERKGITVTVGENTYPFTGIDASDRAADPAPGSFYLTLFSMGTWAYGDRYGMDVPNYLKYFIPAGGNAETVEKILAKDFRGHTSLVYEMLGTDCGVQIERVLPDGNTECWFAHPDGYLFAPSRPSEYADSNEFISLVTLPSGLNYAVIGEEEFALLAALEAAYGGKRPRWDKEISFMTHEDLLASEYGKYCLCVSSGTEHLDLSVFQAEEFLTRYLKWDGSPVSFSDGPADPQDRSDLRDLIRISEYLDRAMAPEQIYDKVSDLYLTPSGRLVFFGGNQLAFSGGEYVISSCLRVYSSDRTFDYGAVKALLEAAAARESGNT